MSISKAADHRPARRLGIILPAPASLSRLWCTAYVPTGGITLTHAHPRATPSATHGNLPQGTCLSEGAALPSKALNASSLHRRSAYSKCLAFCLTSRPRVPFSIATIAGQCLGRLHKCHFSLAWPSQKQSAWNTLPPPSCRRPRRLLTSWRKSQPSSRPFAQSIPLLGSL